MNRFAQIVVVASLALIAGFYSGRLYESDRTSALIAGTAKSGYQNVELAVSLDGYDKFMLKSFTRVIDNQLRTFTCVEIKGDFAYIDDSKVVAQVNQ